ncbi:response regulator transcription factor [Amycolatopsis alkalitolerans]|uniref:Response regulator transcription factor n=1 Tax=Amycolatopsis alkalitolerans TaxID=2547244 RepID=A0A5C4LUW5_9PSEU|nr:response regulator transcription factor [Amycolatopsis alkalitolerans]TNC21572.1 response regulator transcription factor [Amycolatopsis alkalitolerans]
MNQPIRVLLADDQRMFREAIRALLEMEGDITVAAEATTGEEAIEAALAHDVDVALLDIEMPGGDGLTVAKTLRRRGARCRCLIVTTFGRAGYLHRALDAEVAGFVVKDASAAALAQAIRKCAAGQRVIDPGLAAAAHRTGSSPLSPREREVLQATTSGAAIAEIARTLYLSEGTVRNRISTAITKLGARNRTDAVRIATSNGWL